MSGGRNERGVAVRPDSQVAQDAAVRLAALWAGASVVALDVETCTADDGDHVVSVGAVKLIGGHAVGTYASLVNPGVPVNHTGIHGLTDADVATAPSFAQIADDLTRLLTPTGDETIALAAHNAGFDVSRLRLEFDRLGQALPDLPVLDTMKLAPLLGVVPQARPSLAAVLSALGLTNPNPHEALSDATAVANIVRQLLTRAAGDGRTSLTGLLAEAPGRVRRTLDVAAATAVRAPERAGRRQTVPQTHAAGHTLALPDTPTDADLTAWADHATECAQPLCPELEAKARLAAPHAAALVNAAESLLTTRVAAATATAANAGDIAPANAALLLATLLAAHAYDSRELLRFHDRVSNLITALGACDPSSCLACPGCQEGEGCVLDTWHQHVARAVLVVGADDLVPKDNRSRYASPAGTKGQLLTWINNGRGALAGYALWLIAETWASEGNAARRTDLASHGWTWGLHEPRLVVHHARRTQAMAPTPAAGLAAAVQVCDTALAHRTSDPAWLEVLAERDRLAAFALSRTPRPRYPSDDVRLVRPPGREPRLRFKPAQ